MKSVQERHRPGLLKQQNKVHKHGSHRSKHALNSQESKKPTGVKVLTKKLKKCVSKHERINRMQQQRAKKRDEILEKKRQLGGIKSPPFLVAVVSLSFDVDTEKCLEIVKGCSENSDVARSTEGVLHLSLERLKQRFSFSVPEKGNAFSILDVLKVADTVLFLTSALSNPCIDAVAEKNLVTVLAQGLPSIVVAITDLEKIPLKKRSNCKQEIQKCISQYVPDEKVMTLDTSVDALNLLRKIGSQKQRTVFQRDHRPHLLAEHLEFSKDDNSESGTLKVSGFLRGRMLSVHSLVHIPGWGDFQMSQIDVNEDPRPRAKKNGEEGTVRVLQVADPSKRRDLTSENVPDPMDAEQTWPTDEDFNAADKERKEKRKIKRVPKGTSDYQACWIPDEDDEEFEEDDEEDCGDETYEKMESESESESEDDQPRKVRFEEPANDTATEADSDVDEYDEIMNMDEENKAREKFEEAKMDRMFPDEVDTPLDVPARERFQKYRGLASFRTSPWDPKENLPYDYARIFQFENFKRTRKRVFSELENEQVEGATPGMFLTVHVIGVPSEKFGSRRPGESLVLYGMLDHEQKMSAVNMILKRSSHSPLSDIPIKSKEELVFQCGFRRYKARPIFSQHTNGSKHKYERYFQPDSIVVATVFAPVIFPPASVLVFKENRKEGLDLLATGSVLSVNPDRLIIKRVVLSGHPIKILKRSAVIRFMFFNREDIDWFKPVELKSKYGRRGHIKEPLGTHGHMKAVFDGQLKSQDTVLMYLYKRIFPKWSYEPMVKHTASEYNKLPVIHEEDMEEDSLH